MDGPLPRSFFAREAARVAPELLGAVLHYQGPDGRLVRARVVETEAYVGQEDLACHAARGRTARTEVMFGPAGHAYVYLIYGMYDMLNVVTGAAGDPQAVLLRAAEALDGLEARLDGPGRLCRGLGVTRALNGADLVRGPLTLHSGRPPEHIAVSPRIGVESAGSWAGAPLRFFDAASPAVSRRRADRK
jgi:DNA-3-methyladenine glycosylase